jgi:hypothetical protein
MKPGLSYGRITLGYEEDDQVRPLPLVTFSGVRFRGKVFQPKISDRDALLILKLRGQKDISFTDAYIEAICLNASGKDEISEGKALLRWLKERQLRIKWKKRDLKLHPLFLDEKAPNFTPDDELAKDHLFSISPVKVLGRCIKLYVEDEAMLSLINLQFGEEEDFLSLVRRYVARRIQWEIWRAPAPPFADWVRNEGKKPVFRKGQLGFVPMCIGQI